MISTHATFSWRLFARILKPLRSRTVEPRHAARRFGSPPDNLIISLTTFPPRVGKVHSVVQSLLSQSLRVRKIVLYLSLCEFPDQSIPWALASLQQERFEIRYVPDNIGPYKKLLYALDEFPGCWIATCDDDRVCPPNWLARLWNATLDYPGTIICTRGRRILSQAGEFRPYEEWPRVKSFGPSFFLLPVGGWGVLYPPSSFPSTVGDRELICTLAPLQDDLWFKVMSLQQDVPCVAAGGHKFMQKLEFDDQTNLSDLNKTQNDIVWSRLLQHFDLGLDSISSKERRLGSPQN
jgi:hypothetical protein